MGCNPLGELSRPFVAYTGGVVPTQFWLNDAGSFVANYGGGVVPYEVIAHVAQYDLGDPGDRILIEGALRSVLRVVPPGGNPVALPVFPMDSMGTVPPLKLRIYRENTPGSIYIDADSQITIPGGTFGVELIAPQGWAHGLPGTISEGGDPPFDVFLVEARIRACVVCCPTPPSGRLTETIPFAALSAVPRRSRRLHMYSQAGGTPQLDLVTDRGGGLAIAATVQGNLGFSLGEQNIGSYTWVSPSIAGFDDLTVIWEVA